MRGGSPYTRARARRARQRGPSRRPVGPGEVSARLPPPSRAPGLSPHAWGTRSLTVALLLSPQAPKEALAQCVLAEVPQQVVGYFSTYKLLPPSNAKAQ